MLRSVLLALAFGFAVIIGVAVANVAAPGGDGKAVTAEVRQAPTPETPDIGPIVRQSRQADLDLTMVVYPGYAGRNDLNFYMIDTDRDWKEVLSFRVLFRHAESGTILEFDLPELHEGHFLLEVLDLPQTGRWTVEVAVVRAEAGEHRFSHQFVLGALPE